MASAVKSRTTQNVAFGTATGGGVVVAVLAWLRMAGYAFWPAEADAAIAMVVSTVVVPLVSRAAAFLRTPAKAAVLALAVMGLLAPGCVTGGLQLTPEQQARLQAFAIDLATRTADAYLSNTLSKEEREKFAAAQDLVSEAGRIGALAERVALDQGKTAEQAKETGDKAAHLYAAARGKDLDAALRVVAAGAPDKVDIGVILAEVIQEHLRELAGTPAAVAKQRLSVDAPEVARSVCKVD